MDLIIDLCGKFAERSDVGLQEDCFVIINPLMNFLSTSLLKESSIFSTEMSFLQQYAYILRIREYLTWDCHCFHSALGLEMNKRLATVRPSITGIKRFIHNDVGDFLHHVNVAQYRAFVYSFLNVAISNNVFVKQTYWPKRLDEQ